MSIENHVVHPLASQKFLTNMFTFLPNNEIAIISRVNRLWHTAIFKNPLFTPVVFSFLPAFRVVVYSPESAMLMTVGASRHKINMVFNEAIGCWNIQLIKSMLSHEIVNCVPWHSLEVLFIESFPHHEPLISETLAQRDSDISKRALFDEAIRNRRWPVFLQILDFNIRHNVQMGKLDLQAIYDAAAQAGQEEVCLRIAQYAQSLGHELTLVIFVESTVEIEDDTEPSDQTPLLREADEQTEFGDSNETTVDEKEVCLEFTDE